VVAGFCPGVSVLYHSFATAIVYSLFLICFARAWYGINALGAGWDGMGAAAVIRDFALMIPKQKAVMTGDDGICVSRKTGFV
jgi:hypothetical protein